MRTAYNPTVYAAEATGSGAGLDILPLRRPPRRMSRRFPSKSHLDGGNQAASGAADFSRLLHQLNDGTPAADLTPPAHGRGFREAIGVALLNPTAANLQTVISTDPAFAFSPNTVTGVVANALILNGENLYTAGVRAWEPTAASAAAGRGCDEADHVHFHSRYEHVRRDQR